MYVMCVGGDLHQSNQSNPMSEGTSVGQSVSQSMIILFQKAFAHLLAVSVEMGEGLGTFFRMVYGP